MSRFVNEDTRILLALLAGLNKTMGDAYLKLTGTMTNGVLDPAQLRYLALIFGDMTTLLRFTPTRSIRPARPTPRDAAWAPEIGDSLTFDTDTSRALSRPR